MPRVLALDSKPIKRRRWEINKETGAARTVSAGERNGEIMVIADREASPATPILAVLEGGKDSESWLRTFVRLPAGDPPYWVVADLDGGIDLAVRTAWPTAILYRCEEHLRKRMRLALTEDGIPHKVSRDEAKRLGSTRKKRARVLSRRGLVDTVDHPLFSLVGRSLLSSDDWALLKAGVEAHVPKAKRKIRKWISDNDALVLAQFDLKSRHPDMPFSAGGVEGTLSAIGSGLEKRGGFFSNARRLDLLLGLMRLETIGLASEVRYSELIGQFIAGRDRAGMDWQSPRDMLGTSSIDDRIDFAVREAQIAEVARTSEKRKVADARRVAQADVLRDEEGLLPTHTPRARHPDGGLTYYPIAKGQTVEDTPGVREYWRPEYNDGVAAIRVRAGSGNSATWVCDEHVAEGHLHIWKRRVIDFTTSRTMCPFCAHKQACPTTCLATQYADLVKREWAYDRNDIDPTKVLPGCGLDAVWRCPKHGLFSQRISARTKKGQGCSGCGKERQSKGATERATARTREARRVAAAVRAPVRPPLSPKVAVRKSGPAASGLTVSAAAALLHRSTQTIRNWIRSGRITATPWSPPRGRPTWLISAAEIERIRSFVQPEDAAGDPAE